MPNYVRTNLEHTRWRRSRDLDNTRAQLVLVEEQRDLLTDEAARYEKEVRQLDAAIAALPAEEQPELPPPPPLAAGGVIAVNVRNPTPADAKPAVGDAATSASWRAGLHSDTDTDTREG